MKCSLTQRRRDAEGETKAAKVLFLSFLAVISLLPQITLAHSELVASSPAPGETTGSDLNEIRLEFSEPVSAESQILLFTSDFSPVPLTTYHDTRNPSRIYAPVSDLSTGSYIVQWTAVSPDGHQIEGSFQFRVANSSSLLQPANLLFIFAVVILAIIVFLWRRNKSQRRTINSQQSTV
jgi:methionine-rich copper-binding protein CopC